MKTQEDTYNELSHKIIEIAISIHKELGPGLMESIYEACMIKVLHDANLNIKSQVNVPIFFRGEKLPKCFVIDLIVEDKIIIELKSVEKIQPVHEAQLVSYLKLSGLKLGLLINFNETLIRQGLRRKINGNLNE